MRSVAVLVLVLLFALVVPASAQTGSDWDCTAASAVMPKINLPARPWGPKLAGFISQVEDTLDSWLAPPDGGFILLVRCQ